MRVEVEMMREVLIMRVLMEMEFRPIFCWSWKRAKENWILE